MVVIAKSASDKSDDWPYWMIWNGYLNITAEVTRSLGLDNKTGAVFCGCQEDAEALAEAYNAWQAA